MTLQLLYLIIEKMQYNNIGKFIRYKRESISKSLNEFAFDCGIEPATLSNFENQKSDVLLQNFLKIVDGFNQTPAEFFIELQNKK